MTATLSSIIFRPYNLAGEPDAGTLLMPSFLVPSLTETKDNDQIAKCEWKT